MAIPIKVTPVLSGAASKHFNEPLKANSAKVPKEERDRMLALVEKVLAKNK